MKPVKTIIMVTCILLLPLTAPAAENEEELEPIEILSTRTSIKEENQSTAITIITQEEIQQKQHMQVKDILREQLGINVVTVGPMGSLSTVFMRGAGSASTLVMIDGVQVNANTTGGYNFANLQMDNIERIEIHVNPGHFSVCNIAKPGTGLEAKFSLRFTAAMALAGVDTASIEIFTDELTQDPILVAFRDKIEIIAHVGNHQQSLTQIKSAEAKGQLGTPNAARQRNK